MDLLRDVSKRGEVSSPCEKTERYAKGERRGWTYEEFPSEKVASRFVDSRVEGPDEGARESLLIKAKEGRSQ